MAETSEVRACLSGLAAFWDRSCEPWLRPRSDCTIGCVITHQVEGVCGYMSLASDVESIMARTPEWYSLSSAAQVEISEDEALARLVAGSVAAFVTRIGPLGVPWRPSDWLQLELDRHRLERTAARNLLLEIGLQSVQSYGGPPADLLDALSDYWNADLATSLDVATELAQGASRQRFVDHAYTGRARLRLESVESVLIDRDVRSNPLLVI